MERIIKFRAWDKEMRRMFEINSIDFNEYKQGKGKNILLQFTGLKDKNGKEIYEGDLVNLYLGGGKDNNIWKCEWCVIDACFQFTNVFDKDDFFMLDLNPSCITIMGNVYENQDLLEGR